MSDKRNINSAYRLLILLSAAVAKEAQATQLQVWVTAFGLQHLTGRPQKQAASRGIDLIYEQLDRLVGQLKALNHSEESYRELVAKIEQNVSVEYLSHPWGDFRTRLETIIYPLKILANTIPHEENVIDAADLTVIREELDKLEQSLAKKNISAAVREYVSRQVGFIRRAIWEYQFRGVHAFDDAVLDGIREAYVNSSTVERHKDEPEVQEISKLWTKVWHAVINAGKVGAALDAGERFYHLVESTLKISGHH